MTSKKPSLKNDVISGPNEETLRERERQYRTLVEQIPVIVYIDNVGTDIHTLYISPQVESILGFTPEQGFHTHAIEKTDLRLGECFAGRAAFERHTIHVPNLPDTGSNFTRASILEGEGFLEFYAMPLIAIMKNGMA